MVKKFISGVCLSPFGKPEVSEPPGSDVSKNEGRVPISIVGGGGGSDSGNSHCAV